MEKRILIISDYVGSGKTTLVEKLVGQKLIWEESLVQGKIKTNRSQCSYNGANLVFTEVEPLMETDKEAWPEIIQMIMDADLILHVHPSPEKKVLDVLDDLFFDIDYKVFEEEIMPKRFIVFTYKNSQPPEVVWYENLTDEAREKFEANWASENGPGSTFIDGWLNDFYLCLGLWLSMNVNGSNDKFKTDIEPADQGFDELRQRMTDFLGI